MESEEIREFLSEWYWYIAPERNRTRKACEEVLSRLPEDLTESIMYRKTVILIAPAKTDLGLARPVSFWHFKHELLRSLPTIQTPGGKPSAEREVYKAEFSVVYLSPDLEDATSSV